MKKIYSIVPLVLLVSSTIGQTTGSIRGFFVDTTTKQALADVTVTVLEAKDSSLVTFSRSHPHRAQLLRHKRPDHGVRLVRLRTGLGDPHVAAAFEHFEVALAAGFAVGLGELVLDRRNHVVVERALQDEHRRHLDQGHRRSPRRAWR